MNLKHFIIIALKGMAMGAADLVPGISGGTVALITGIYENLIKSLNKINLKTHEKFVNFLCEVLVRKKIHQYHQYVTSHF